MMTQTQITIRVDALHHRYATARAERLSMSLSDAVLSALWDLGWYGWDVPPAPAPADGRIIAVDRERCEVYEAAVRRWRPDLTRDTRHALLRRAVMLAAGVKPPDRWRQTAHRGRDHVDAACAAAAEWLRAWPKS